MQRIITFRLGEEYYGIDILDIIEIIEPADITPVPRSADWVEGIINLHGRVVTVVNLDKFLQYESPQGVTLKRIAVLDDPEILIGLFLQGQLEVISTWEVKEDSRLTKVEREKYVSSVILSNGRIVSVIDIKKLMSDMEGFFS